MKIKTKKQMNLPQLIEWAWDNGIDSKTFTSPTGGNISFDEYGDIVDVYSIEPNDTFTVTVEKELTEDTELHYIFLITNNTSYSEGYYNYSINDILSDNEGYYQELAMLIMEPEPTIIWTREKGLVE